MEKCRVTKKEEYWFNYWDTSCNKGTSGFTSNTLLITMQSTVFI